MSIEIIPKILTVQPQYRPSLIMIILIFVLFCNILDLYSHIIVQYAYFIYIYAYSSFRFYVCDTVWQIKEGQNWADLPKTKYQI